MKKRFLSTSLACLFLLSALNWGMCYEPDEPYWPYEDSAPQGKIGYITPDSPEAPVKPYTGERYEDWIPDTIDAAERADFCINVLTCGTNKNQDHEQYFSFYLGNPLRMAHNFSDWCTPKYMEALPLLRYCNGATFYNEVDRVWMDVILKSLGPDGLYYFPIEGKPWYGKELWWSNGIARPDGTIFSLEKPNEELLEDLDTYAKTHAHSVVEESGITQFSHPQPCGRIMNTMLIYYMRDPNPIWKDAILKMADRLKELAIDKGDYAYFPALYFEPNAVYDKTDPRCEEPQGLPGAEINGRVLKSLSLCYKLFKHEPAIELAGKVANFMRYHNQYYGPNGEFTAPLETTHRSFEEGTHNHFHTHTMTMFGMLEYATAVNDEELLDFIRKSFEWAKSPESGASYLGYMPESTKWHHEEDHVGEGCPVGDMLAWGVKLSEYGVADYYEDCERWFRNYYAEIQLTPDKVKDLDRRGGKMEKGTPLYNETIDQVGERTMGAFAGWPTGNEFVHPNRSESDNIIMHCCTGNCTRACYFLWKNIVDETDATLKVNMLLNRACATADIYSYIPFEGQVDIKIKQDCKRVLVHAPEWIGTGSGDMTVKVNDKARTFKWDERYIDLGSVDKGQKIVVQFPISEWTMKDRMATVDFDVLMKGNTAVSIDPPGEACPLFERQYYRRDYTPWRKVTRFVTDEKFDY